MTRSLLRLLLSSWIIISLFAGYLRGQTTSSKRPSPCCSSSKNANDVNNDLPRIFYLIVVHNNRTIQDAVHLVRAIRHPRNIILIHIDSKAKDLLDQNTELHQEIKDCPCGTILMDSKFSAEWSRWSMNLPTLWGLQVAVQDYSGQWDLWINLSGDTLPVYTPDALARRLNELPYNFVTSAACETGFIPTNVYDFPSWWHKRAHYTRDDTEPDPTFFHRDQDSGYNQTIITYFGSQWMILQADFCQWIVQQLQRPDSLASLFRDYLEASGKLMTDETFFASLLMQVHPFNNSIPKVNSEGFLLWKNGSASEIWAVRYERMDEHVPTSFGHFPTDQRYEVPNSSRTVEPTRPWGPYFLGVYDLAAIRESGALFARKISDQIDPNMVTLLPVASTEQIPHVRWPNEVVVSKKPDWKAKLDHVMANAEGEDETTVDDMEKEEL